MKEIRFDNLKSVKTPEVWIENAVKIPQKNKKPLPLMLRPYIIGSAAALLVMVAAVITLLIHFGGSHPLPGRLTSADISSDTAAVSEPLTDVLSPSETTDATRAHDEPSVTAAPFVAAVNETRPQSAAAASNAARQNAKAAASPQIVPVTKPAAEPQTVPVTKPAAEPPTIPVTQPVTEPLTLPETQPVTEPLTVPETQPVTEPLTVPVTQPVTETETIPKE